MRTARYHDYTVLRVLLFIALVALAFLAFKNFVKLPCKHEAIDNVVKVDATCTEDGYTYKVCADCGEQFDNQVIEAHGHKAMEGLIENEKPHTLTEGGSYELVINCSECSEELSRETVNIDGAHVPVIVEKEENPVEATCTTDGSYELVKTCKGCDAELSRETIVIKAQHGNAVESTDNYVDATCTENGSYDTVHSCEVCGVELSRESFVIDATKHDYESWEMKYDSEKKEFYIEAVCKNETESVIISAADSIKYTFDEAYPACCHNVYNVTYTYGDVVMEGKVEIPAVPHKVLYTAISEDSGKIENMSYDLPAPEVDEVYGEYYNVDKLPGIILFTPTDGSINEWNEDGFALGTYKCESCNQFFIVTIYSAKYDTRSNIETN